MCCALGEAACLGGIRFVPVLARAARKPLQAKDKLWLLLREDASKSSNTGGTMAPTEVVVVLNKPTVGTKLVRWPGPIRSPVVSALTVLSCAGLHH